MERSKAEFETFAVAEIRGADEWRAKLELIKRRNPEHWGDSQRLSINKVAMEELAKLVLTGITAAVERTLSAHPALGKAVVTACMEEFGRIPPAAAADIARLR